MIIVFVGIIVVAVIIIFLLSLLPKLIVLLLLLLFFISHKNFAILSQYHNHQSLCLSH